jgi:hypothetical protein
MNGIFTNEIELQKDFTFTKLYSSTKASASDKNLSSFLANSFRCGLIKVKKYLIANDVEDEMLNIEEWKAKSHIKIKPILKDWHSESDYSISPIIYFLERLEPNFIVEPNKETSIYEIKSNKNIIIGHRFTSVDAFARILLPDEKIIINLVTDSLHNLIDVLALEGYIIYLLDVEYVGGRPMKMIAYHLIADPNYQESYKAMQENRMDEIFVNEK